MGTFILYLLKANIVLAVLYGFYRLCLRRDTFLGAKRTVLLSIYAAALICPLVDLPTDRMIQESSFIHPVVESLPMLTLPEVVISEQGQQGPGMTLYDIIATVYLSGIAVIAVWILLQIISVASHLSGSRRAKILGVRVRISPPPTPPYSFLRWIVIDERTAGDNDIEEILLHEKHHVDNRHSADTMLATLMCALCWFNPLAWMMRHDVRLNLEFLADRSVLRSGCDARGYQYHILRLSYPAAATNISNNFNVSPLKKRIKMMNQKRTSAPGYAKYLLFVPLLAALMLVNRSQAMADIGDSLALAQSKDIVAQSKTFVADNGETVTAIGPYKYLFFLNGKSVPLSEIANKKMARINTTEAIPNGSPTIAQYGIPDLTGVFALTTKEDSNESEEIIITVSSDKPGDLQLTFSNLDGTKNGAVGISNDDVPFLRTQVMPKFDGGTLDKFKQWLFEQVTYPQSSLDANIQGTVVATFIIERDGSVSNVEIRQSPDEALAEEVIRALQLSPRWEPAQHEGKVVRIRMSLPITFRL